MITHFTRIIYPDYLGFYYCSTFRGKNNRDNRSIPIYHGYNSSYLHMDRLIKTYGS
jgi:hypothetical protein